MNRRLATLLLEVGCEEIPASAIQEAISQITPALAAGLDEAKIQYEDIWVSATPRRLAAVVRSVSTVQDDLTTEVRGPAKKIAYDKEGMPTKALLGFMRTHEAGEKDLLVKNTSGGEYVFVRKTTRGRPSKEVLSNVLPSVIQSLAFPRSMRWGNHDMRFVRPIRWILCLLGSEVVPFEIAGVKSGRRSFGHRSLWGKKPIIVKEAADYVETLREAHVIVDLQERIRLIWAQVRQAASSVGGAVEEDEDLLMHVANLVEYPRAFVGAFDRKYLSLPHEVLKTSMKRHQKYFPVSAPDGVLLPFFVAVRNGGDDGLDFVREGNERVLRARLSDAHFFYLEDQKEPLSEKVPILDRVLYVSGLGSLGDKRRRLENLVESLVATLPESNGKDTLTDVLSVAKRAAFLSKADLVTHMVGEFPELQGIMGMEYARLSGERPDVARAIYEHYLPRFANDLLPETPAGSILSLADKMDSITGCFMAGYKPSGSQDPYGLRRMALGIIRILMNGRPCDIDIAERLMLDSLMRESFSAYHRGKREGQKVQGAKRGAAGDSDTLFLEICDFLLGRLRGVLFEMGFDHEIVEATLSACGGKIGFMIPLKEVMQRLQALSEFLSDESFEEAREDLLVAQKRVCNLGKKGPPGEPDPRLFDDGEEGASRFLYDEIKRVFEETRAPLEQRDYLTYLSTLSTLRRPVDAFLDDVLVMDPDERKRDNHLRLLRLATDLFGGVYDLSELRV